MSITISLRPEIERRLAARAAQAGLTLEEFLQQLAERASVEAGAAAETANGAARPAPSFEEMTGPVAQAVEATGMTEDELGDFFADVRKEVRAAKRARQGPSITTSSTS